MNPLITAATKAACTVLYPKRQPCRAPTCKCLLAPGVAIMVLRAVVQQHPVRWEDPLWVELYGDVTPRKDR